LLLVIRPVANAPNNSLFVANSKTYVPLVQYQTHDIFLGHFRQLLAKDILQMYEVNGILLSA